MEHGKLAETKKEEKDEVLFWYVIRFSIAWQETLFSLKNKIEMKLQFEKKN